MIRFVQRATGEIFRALSEVDGGLWMISFDEPAVPFFAASAVAESLERIETPKEFLEAQKRTLTKAETTRLALIQPLINDEKCIVDRGHRLNMAKEVAAKANTTTKRVLRVYYRYLATAALGSHPGRETKKRPEFDWAIQKFYFSSKRLSLRASYDMMLVQKYTDSSGQLKEDAPSWNSFSRYYYAQGYHKKPERIIARDGLTYYQRNHRPIFGSASEWRSQSGSYQMDATEGDVYLVSRYDRSSVIGRPYIYMAVDTATQLIAGVYIGLEAGELSVLKTLENAACDKVAFCRQHGIKITPDQWPNSGLPSEIITDKGRDFLSVRVQEFSAKYGIEIQSLPPFRPEQKPLVEKSFDLLQSRYKPLLRGKGVIEEDAQERWSKDYRAQAILDLDEFTAIVIQCILYINSGRLLSSGKTPAQTWLDASPSLLCPDMEELHHFTLPRTMVKLTRKGFSHNGMIYIPEAANQFHIGDKYEIIFDPSDSSRIYICKNGHFLPARLSCKFDQFQGLSESEIQALKKTQQKNLQTARQSEVAASVTATQAVQSIIHAAEQRRDNIQQSLTGGQIAENRLDEIRRLT